MVGLGEAIEGSTGVGVKEEASEDVVGEP